MDLGESDKSVLVLWLADAIGRSHINNWAVYSKDLEPPRLSEKTSGKLAKMLERGSIIDFYQNQLFRHVLKGCSTPLPEDAVPVRTIDGYSDTYNIAKEIIEEFLRLPQRYRVIVRASSSMSAATKGRQIDLRLSDRLSIISSSLLKDKVIFKTGNDNIDEYTFRYNRIDHYKLADDHLYFVYDAAGCMGSHHGKIVSDFLHEIRAFYGACVAHDLLYPHSYHRDPVNPIIMGIEYESNLITHVDSLDTDLVDCTYFIPSARLQNRYLKSEKFYKSLNDVVEFFSSSSEKLKTAAIWLLRGCLENRQRVLSRGSLSDSGSACGPSRAEGEWPRLPRRRSATPVI